MKPAPETSYLVFLIPLDWLLRCLFSMSLSWCVLKFKHLYFRVDWKQSYYFRMRENKSHAEEQFIVHKYIHPCANTHTNTHIHTQTHTQKHTHQHEKEEEEQQKQQQMTQFTWYFSNSRDKTQKNLLLIFTMSTATTTDMSYLQLFFFSLSLSLFLQLHGRKKSTATLCRQSSHFSEQLHSKRKNQWIDVALTMCRPHSGSGGSNATCLPVVSITLYHWFSW